MNRRDLNIYRELYATGGSNGSLLDIWEKLTYILEENGLDGAIAEVTALKLTEWIRTTWGGLILNERHIGDPRPAKPSLVQPNTPLLIQEGDQGGGGCDPLTGSRFAALRDQATTLLNQTPFFDKKGPGGISVIAMEIVQAVRRDYRGSYIPRIVKLDKLQRDREIWLKGNSAAQIEELARRNGISIVRAYQVNRAYQLRLDKIEQPVLPWTNEA